MLAALERCALFILLVYLTSNVSEYTAWLPMRARRRAGFLSAGNGPTSSDRNAGAPAALCLL